MKMKISWKGSHTSAGSLSVEEGINQGLFAEKVRTGRLEVKASCPKKKADRGRYSRYSVTVRATWPFKVLMELVISFVVPKMHYTYAAPHPTLTGRSHP